MVEDLGFARLSLGNEGVVKDVKDILADVLEFGLDLLTIIADGGDVLISSLGLLLLLDGGDYTPGCTSSSNNVLVGHRQKVAFIDGQLATKLGRKSESMEIGRVCAPFVKSRRERG